MKGSCKSIKTGLKKKMPSLTFHTSFPQNMIVVTWLDIHDIMHNITMQIILTFDLPEFDDKTIVPAAPDEL